MSDINRVVLSGRVGQDAETMDAGGSTLCKFSLAVSRYTGPDTPEETTWVDINLWGNRANVGAFIKKGMLLLVEGRLQIRKVEKDGQTRYYTSVNADNVKLPDRGDKGEGGASSSGARSRSRKSSPPSDSDFDGF